MKKKVLLAVAASAGILAVAAFVMSVRRARLPARLFISNEDNGTVTVIDPSDHGIVATIPVGKRPRGIQVSPDGRTVYVALSGSPAVGPPGNELRLEKADDGNDGAKADRGADGIGVIDARTNEFRRTLISGSDPEQFAIASDGQRLYVANEDAAELSVIDVRSNAMMKAVKVGKEPEGVTLAPDNRTVWVTSEGDGKVYVVDALSSSLVAAVEVGARPRAVAVTRDNTRAIVTLENEGAVAIVDATAKKLARTVKLTGANMRPMGVVLAPDDKTAYVTTGRGKNVVAIDIVAGAASWSVEVGDRPWGIAISPDGHTIYTANGTSDDVSILDVRQRAVVTKIRVGGRPWGIALREG